MQRLQDRMRQPWDAAVLRLEAGAVLHRNDLGRRTKASPSLYPHQWSWDSAFIAIGLVHLDAERACTELDSLFDAQWANGKVPHIVYNPDAPAGSYFPSGDHWICATEDPDASPPRPVTSGLIQPPAHAIAALQVWQTARRRAAAANRVERCLRRLYPRLLAWHRYLLTARDPERSGLVTIYHPWESGLDNSPRWDAPLAAVTPGEIRSYQRADLEHVTYTGERPTQADYDRYVWLVQSVLEDCYDETRIYRRHPFLVKDVLASALLVAANLALAQIAGLVGAPDRDRREIAAWVERGRRGLDACWDPDLGLGLDYDLRAERALPVRTIAGFAPLVAAAVAADRQASLVATLESEAFLDHPNLAWRLPPSTSPLDPGFRPRAYWRGPVWPVMTWLLWWALRRAGQQARATWLRRTALAQLRAARGFPEYLGPFTGAALGSVDQSWTAAVALDWLAADHDDAT